MLFFLTKIFNFLLSPIIWILIGFALFIVIKNNKMKKVFLFSSLFLLLFFTSPIIFQYSSNLLNVKAVNYNNLDSVYDYGIVLGGTSSYDSTYLRVNFSAASDRLFQAVDLYNKGIIKKIIISGGTINKNKPPESDFLKKYLTNMGIPDTNIIAENKSRNTYENAYYTSKLLDADKNVLLITSSIHVYRAKKCFNKVGINVDVFPTNYNSESSFYFRKLVPSSQTLASWQMFIHELVGLLVYKYRGYI